MFIRRQKSNLFVLCLGFLAIFSFACSTDGNSNSGGSSLLDFSSDTEKAVKLVLEANGELKRIKILYNDNKNALQDLKEATKNRETEKIRTIANLLVYVINDGFILADSAKSKVEQAQELDIHQDFKDYLSLKEESLEKQIEAFQALHEAARILRDSAGSQDKEQAERSRLNFKEKEENFQKMMEEAKKISLQADELAKESTKNAELNP